MVKIRRYLPSTEQRVLAVAEAIPMRFTELHDDVPMYLAMHRRLE